jgi:hypothetical protein
MSLQSKQADYHQTSLALLAAAAAAAAVAAAAYIQHRRM